MINLKKIKEEIKKRIQVILMNQKMKMIHQKTMKKRKNQKKIRKTKKNKKKK